MNIILLSGGAGKRLWPLSNEVRAKQFLKVFKRPDGSRESMIQRICRMIAESDKNARITIATSESQIASINAQVGDAVKVSIEPCRRDTFPAIILATMYLHDIEGINDEEPIVVCPVDPFVESDFFSMLLTLNEQAKKEEANIVLMGVEPTYPSEKYGYIIPKTMEQLTKVKQFKEKPQASEAEEYISKGALWNAGVFAFKMKYLRNKAKEILGTSSYHDIYEKYAELNRISFDYAIVEKEPEIQVMRFGGQWKDLGTWDTLTEAMSEDAAGKAIVEECVNTHVINELQIPLVALGVSNLIVVATPDGMLVADKGKSSKLKDFVPEHRTMYEKSCWGEYQVLDYRIQEDGKNHLTKRLMIKPGQHISYHRHANRIEMWTCVDGAGEIIIDGVVSKIERGDTACILPGTKHAIKANTELHVIEIQIGNELTEDDVERLSWDWE